MMAGTSVLKESLGERKRRKEHSIMPYYATSFLHLDATT